MGSKCGGQVKILSSGQVVSLSQESSLNSLCPNAAAYVRELRKSLVTVPGCGWIMDRQAAHNPSTTFEYVCCSLCFLLDLFTLPPGSMMMIYRVGEGERMMLPGIARSITFAGTLLLFR